MFGLPIIIGFPIAIVAVLVSAVWLAVLRIPGVRGMASARAARGLALAVYALFTGMGLLALANDLSEIL